MLSLFDEWLADRPDLRRMFALWIRATLMGKTEYRIVLPRIDDLQELNVMLAERLEEWAQAYKAEGKAEGGAGVAEAAQEAFWCRPCGCPVLVKRRSLPLPSSRSMHDWIRCSMPGVWMTSSGQAQC
ncbi:MAG: hypothetical protein V5B39_13390 [Accumulibacter sp.]|uniref:hypothetical protein n=1 Tax=Accumulibacter sp. TaxID=2053492 RepID=UPI002FC319B2